MNKLETHEINLVLNKQQLQQIFTLYSVVKSLSQEPPLYYTQIPYLPLGLLNRYF